MTAARHPYDAHGSTAEELQQLGLGGSRPCAKPTDGRQTVKRHTLSPVYDVGQTLCVLEGFPERLAEAIQAKGMKPYRAEELAGLKRGHINHILSGKRRNVSAETLLKLQQVLDVSVDWLLTGALPRTRSESLPADPAEFLAQMKIAIAAMQVDIDKVPPPPSPKQLPLAKRLPRRRVK